MREELIVVGGGGHALSVATAARAAGYTVRGLVAPRAAQSTAALFTWLGDEDRLNEPGCRALRLLNGIGSTGAVDARRSAYNRLRSSGHQFACLIHPAANLCDPCPGLGHGVLILAGALINAAVDLGDNVLVNSGAIVEHGCRVGSHSHVASGAILCGDVELGEAVHVGAGATLIQGVRVGDGAVIAAGAVVTKDVEPLTLMAGVPARPIRRIHEQELA